MNLLTRNGGSTVDTDNPEPFTQAEAFAWIDRLPSTSTAILAAVLFLVALPMALGFFFNR